ncbi:MAG: MarR family transcriptional regulator [Chloroflexota bacterium]|nr:MarR family transcriptional regulator [Chloroflexota bacterium]
MTAVQAGSLSDEIMAELAPFMAYQRHKWAAQCQAYGLSMAHFQILAILETDGPTSMSRLADQLGVADPNLTGIIGRMEERRVVERVHDKEDRRVVLARLTDSGRDVLKQVEDTRLAHMRQLVGILTAEEQQTVLSALKTLTLAHARAHEAAEHPDLSHSSAHEELLQA